MKSFTERLHKFANLSWNEQLMLFYSAILLLTIVLSLKISSFSTVRSLLKAISQITSKLPQPNEVAIDKIVWSIKVASRYVRGAVCLPQALAVQLWLARYKYSSELQIGVAHHEKGRISAHAWLEKEEKVVIGECEYLARFIPLSINNLEKSNKKNWFLLSTK